MSAVIKTDAGRYYQIVDGKKVRISKSKYDEISKAKSPQKKPKRPSKTSKKTTTTTQKRTPAETTPTTHTRFYDDAPENIADVIAHGQIECIHVPRVNTIVPSKMTYNDFVSRHGGWNLKTTDKDLQQVLTSLKSEIDTEEVSDALTSVHMSELRKWVRSKPDGSCRVMFDFDRVINQVEGMIAGSLKSIQDQGLNIPGLAKYHIGSKNRLKDFRKTINELLKHNATVSVVTNNPGCRDESFVAVLNYIHPVFTSSTVHCSFRFANKLNCMSARNLVK